MKYSYVYVLDSYADWELGYVTAELESRRYFRSPETHYPVRTVSATKEPIRTMGGLTIFPDTTPDELTPENVAVLLLPGADTWHEPQHAPIIAKTKELLDSHSNIGAICGATVALANAGLLDKRPHTSNSLDYLKHACPHYHGASFYEDKKAVADANLVTANSAGGLLFARYILARLGVFSEDTLAEWYNFFQTGQTQHFLALMQTLPKQGPTEG
ncbi:type 1 glutamine amidotransferase family protein [Kouleothrix sp.]|uniref:type 1 glutamine amidotransferase family protein n=1 Tax=Kouleothrix sp. TaxID=2779161 RepID=UPI00391DF327